MSCLYYNLVVLRRRRSTTLNFASTAFMGKRAAISYWSLEKIEAKNG
jgi:hypothetical protein